MTPQITPLADVMGSLFSQMMDPDKKTHDTLFELEENAGWRTVAST